MPVSAIQLSAIERKLQNKINGVSVKRAKSFGSTSAPTSPSALRRSKQPAVEPRYTKSTYLLIEAKRIAKELEEKKKKGPLFRQPSTKTVSLGLRGRSGSGNSIKAIKRPDTADQVKRPQSPGLARRRRTKSQYVREKAEDDEHGEQGVDNGRFTPFRTSGRRRHFNAIQPSSEATTNDVTRGCDECDRTLKSGFFSEHRGLPYCNVPCYTSLFSSLLHRDDDGDISCSALSEDQKQLRSSLLPRLRTYNTYYADKPCQISCKEMNDKFVLEGIIKVYWGLSAPVTLADSDVSYYWQHFHPEDGDVNENTENQPPKEKVKKVQLSAIRRAKNALQGNTNPSKYKYLKKKSTLDAPRRRAGCAACDHERMSELNSTFIPPYGTPTTLRLTNHVTAPLVIDMLLKKFQIKDNGKRFSLYTVYESGGQRRLPNDSYPLLTRLNLGPCEDVAKIFIMDKADQMEIPLEVAQYINFSTAVLETFVQKFHEEEEREVDRIKDKYKDYRDILSQRLGDMERNNRMPKEE